MIYVRVVIHSIWTLWLLFSNREKNEGFKKNVGKMLLAVKYQIRGNNSYYVCMSIENSSTVPSWLLIHKYIKEYSIGISVSFMWTKFNDVGCIAWIFVSTSRFFFRIKFKIIHVYGEDLWRVLKSLWWHVDFICCRPVHYVSRVWCWVSFFDARFYQVLLQD